MSGNKIVTQITKLFLASTIINLGVR